MRTTIQFGPQHPAWIEPIRLKLTMDGEIVKDAELEAGYVHKGLEKKFESIGFENLFMLCFRDREMVLDVFERTTGNRVLHGINIVGGVIRNLGPEMVTEVGNFCDAIEAKCHDLEKMIAGSYTIRQRMQGVGVMSQKLAEELCVVGPVCRGSNVPYDARSAAPYLLYKETGLKPIVEKSGDCWARTMVRVRELYQSIDVIRQCLPLLEGTPDELFAQSKALPCGENFARVEAPRGELFYYVKGKRSKELDRVKIRTSTYANGIGIVPLIKGSHLADVGLITITFDPCIGCFDR